MAGSRVLRPRWRSEKLPISEWKHTDNTRSPNMLLSGSRDKSLIIWNLTRDDQNYGLPKRSLHGHSHIVSDCVRPSSSASHCSFANILQGYILRRFLRPLCFLGQNAPLVGTFDWCHYQAIRRPQQRRPLRFLFRRQPPNRLWLA